MSTEQREYTEQERLRRETFGCLACNNRMHVGSQYPVGMKIPRTLELWCDHCGVISVHYPRWNEALKEAA